VNAVLRNSKREEFLNSVESLDDNCLSDIPMKYSHPAWMVELLVEDWGRETAIEILRRNNDIPPLVARVNTLRTTRDMLVRQLDADGIMAAPLPQTGEAVKIHSAQAPPSDIQAHKDGLLYFQDAASMLAVQCLDARPGQEIIDVCAGPGGKATHIAALMENKGKILALDIHDHKVGLVQDNAQRLGVSIIETRKEDATAGLEAYHGKMDRVLADVPCSGIGVIRRRLDLKWRLVPERIDECASIQARILESAAECVRTGGILLYCTCTVTQKENSGTVQDFIRRHPEFKIDPELPPHLEKYRTKQGFVQIMPGSEDMDGFFIARLRRF
jgi:16S rRNA (cytosine967-C5)-methyltransferase